MSTMSAAPAPKGPKTARGERTRRKLLDAAEKEFGERGFHATSIGEITRRASVALGTFYVYFDSKDEIFRALVAHMGQMTRHFIAERVAAAPDRLAAEAMGLKAFLDFVREHRDLYRIVMESQFVAPDAYRDYYDSFAEAYRRNLEGAAGKGEIRPGPAEERAWALIGMSVFLGLRYGVWDDSRRAEDIAAAAQDLIERGLKP
ncbi:MAG: TetR/AcrR family transcriptional regulator [Maricaulaceae bacterium]|nr:TetR/AcrR family transcriptional regulator [Maricaulaceae bacterium]